MNFRFCLLTPRRLACSCALFAFLLIAAVDAQARQADLSIAKSVSNATPNVGSTVTFTITLTNVGPNAATGVAVTDVLPAGLTFVSAIISQGIHNSGTGVWTVGTMASGAAATLSIVATVVGDNAMSNTATITAANQSDPVPGNNSSTATVTPLKADLAVVKTVSNATPNVGDTITFTITLTNAGPDTATGVAAADLLPAGLTFVSATPSQGTYNSTTGTWTVGTRATGAPATLSIAATVVSANTMTNTATINAANQFDPNTTNNAASVTVTPQKADLGVVKTVSNATPNVGDTITFTITLTNAGPDPATGVAVFDVLPAGLTLVSATPSQGTYNVAGSWFVGAKATGAPATLSIVATVAGAAAMSNTATITASHQFDPVTGNNTAIATVTPQKANLGVVKTVSNATPNVGDTITFTITLTNAGPDTATGVAATDLLPAGLTFVSATPTQGTYNPSNGAWTVGALTTSTPATLSIAATVAGANAMSNTATITAASQYDPGPFNNSSTVTVTPLKADLIVAKIVSNATPNIGSTISFTVTVTNTGPATATGVAVSDLLPAGLTFVAAIPSQGTYAAATGAWTVGTLPAGANVTLQLQATVTAVTRMSNTASISAANQFDPVVGNNTATVTVTPRFTDDPLATGTPIKAVHVTQLRARIDAQRSRFKLGGFGWTTPSLAPGALVRASHVSELRTALQQAYSAGSFTPPTFTDSPLVLGSTVIRALHINELRNAVIALEGM